MREMFPLLAPNYIMREQMCGSMDFLCAARQNSWWKQTISGLTSLKIPVYGRYVNVFQKLWFIVSSRIQYSLNHRILWDIILFGSLCLQYVSCSNFTLLKWFFLIWQTVQWECVFSSYTNLFIILMLVRKELINLCDLIEEVEKSQPFCLGLLSKRAIKDLFYMEWYLG